MAWRRSFPRSGRELDAHALGEPGRPATAEPSRVVVDEKQITVDGEKKWLYAAVDADSKLLLNIEVFSRRGTDPASFTRAKLSCSPSERFAF